MILIIYIVLAIICSHYQFSINQINYAYMIIANGIFWLLNALFYYCFDILYKRYTSKFNSLYIVKIYDTRETSTFFDMLPISFINMIINHTLILITLYYSQRGIYTDIVPTHIIFIEYMLYYLSYEVSFWLLHALIHTRLLYPLHKLHHTTFGTIAVSCFYMSLFDMLLEIFVPFIIGVLIFNGHLVTLVIWSFSAIINTFKEHSGYGTLTHYYHHSYFKKNYSVLIMDHIMGTKFYPDK